MSNQGFLCRGGEMVPCDFPSPQNFQSLIDVNYSASVTNT